MISSPVTTNTHCPMYLGWMHVSLQMLTTNVWWGWSGWRVVFTCRGPAPVRVTQEGIKALLLTRIQQGRLLPTTQQVQVLARGHCVRGARLPAHTATCWPWGGYISCDIEQETTYWKTLKRNYFVGKLNFDEFPELNILPLNLKDYRWSIYLTLIDLLISPPSWGVRKVKAVLTNNLINYIAVFDN